jgi:non-ribosomal peptide synthetase-like protein
MIKWLAPFFTYHIFNGHLGDSILRAITMSVLVFLVAQLSGFVVAIGGRRIVAPRLEPGRYPLWGAIYYRWWLADRLDEVAPHYLITGSTLFVWYLRALGAKIGRDVVIGSITLRVPEMLSIGDGVSIGTAVNLENARVERGELVIGRIDLASESYVGSYAVLEGNTAIGEGGHLEGKSSLADGGRIPARRVWSGSPARDTGPFDPASLAARPRPSKLRLSAEIVCFLLGSALVSILYFLPVFPAFMLIDSLDDPDRFPWMHGNGVGLQLVKYFVLALPASAALIVCTVLLSALVRWALMPRLRTGRFPVHGWTYVSKWLVNQIQETSLQYLYGVYATIYAPFWYRLLGAKVGKGAEISTALGVVPHMLTVGEDTFIADEVLLGEEEIEGGWMTVQPTIVSRRSFVGNGAYVPGGAHIPDNVLIGVETRAPANSEMHRKGKPFLVPLAPRALEIVAEMRTRSRSELIFDRTGECAAIDFLRRMSPRFDAVSGRPITVHGFRSTFRSWCQAESKDRAAAEIAMGHRYYGPVEARYARDDLFAIRRELLLDWARHLDGAVVVPLRRPG